MNSKLPATALLALAAFIAPQAAEAQRAERSGKQVVEATCVTCHGTGANGAPPTPAWWHFEHCACTICAPLRSAARSRTLAGSRHLPPD